MFRNGPDFPQTRIIAVTQIKNPIKLQVVGEQNGKITKRDKCFCMVCGLFGVETGTPSLSGAWCSWADMSQRGF